MKHKRLNRDGWGFQYYPYYQMRIDCDSFHGMACLIRFTDGEANYWATPKAGRIQVTGEGMTWLELIPDNTKRVITVKYFPDDSHDVERVNYPKSFCTKYRPSIWYVDIIEGIEYDADGIAVFIDKYLDVIFTPEGDVKIDDRDELDKAHDLGELTDEQYEAALKECDLIMDELCSDIAGTNAWCSEVREIVENRIAAGEEVTKMNSDRINELRRAWEAEEKIAHIHGWDFSHIHDRYEEEEDLPWDYKKIIDEYLLPDMKLMDFDTGGGEFLLSLEHPYKNTAATEGYAPNVELCKETLLPLGIDFRPCDDESNIPFDDSSFDMMINRHGSFDPVEAHRLLKPEGLFITQQVGGKNDRDLVEMVLPDVPAPFPDLELSIQRKRFEEAGFEIIRADETFKPIRFYDVGAFVWFAHIIEWEFPGFSVEKCFDKLLEMQEVIDRDGYVGGTIHRYLIVARKKG